MPPKVIPVGDLQLSETAALFQGERDGEGMPISIFITKYATGQGPDQHLHPYQEAFVVTRGTATFIVDGSDHRVEAGHVVVVPAETPHGFENRDDDALEVVSVHPSGRVQQTDL